MKTGTTISNFTRGFDQALKKSKTITNSIPVVAIDHDAYMAGIRESPGLKKYASDFINAGGRLMLIGGLNENASEIKNESTNIAREGNNPYTLPSSRGRPN